MAEDRFKGIFGYLLLNWRVNFLLMLGLGLFGAWAAVTLPREATPEVKIPFANVLTIYPGASARDVEELVTDVIEEKIKNLAGVEEINSSSQLGVSVISVEFAADEDLEDALRRLREAVDGVTDLPIEAEDPQVIEISFTNEPILVLGVGGIDDARLLTLYADDLADEIRTVSGVSTVTVVGAREQEIQVLLDPERLATLQLSIGQVMAALRASNANVPLGQVEIDDFGYDVRLHGRFDTVSDVAAVFLATPQGEVLRLDQLATVRLAFADSSTESRVSSNGQPSTAAVTIQVVKKTGGNIVEIVDQVQATVARARQTRLPPDVFVETFADNAAEIRRSLSDLGDSAVQTLVIVFIVLWLFLGWNIALIAALGVLLTFAMSFIAFEFTDVTVNGISLFSLIIALGLLVDNAMVLIEGIERGVGKPDLRGHAMDMIRQFQKPLIGGTLTTVAAFVPLLLVSGIIGEFLRTIPIVLTATLLSSLFVALAFIPGITVQMLQRQAGERPPRLFDRYYNRFQNWYGSMIERMLHNRRRQNIFIVTLVLLLFTGLAMPFTGILPTGLFPEANVDFVIVNVELPSGALLPQTSQTVAEVEQILRQTPEVKSYVVNLGSSFSGDFGGSQGSQNVASLFINLHKERERTSFALGQDLRQKFTAVGGAEVNVLDISAGPPTSAPVELRVIGPDLDQLEELSRLVMDELRSVPGAIEINRNLRFSAGEFSFTFDPQLLAQFGISPGDAAGSLRTYLFGTEAATFLDEHNEEIEVKLQAPVESVRDAGTIAALPLLNAQGEVIRVGQVATVALDTSINAIRRRDGERAITIAANNDGSHTPSEISAELQRRLALRDFPDGYRFDFGGEQQETVDTFTDLYRSMVIAIILIMIIMVIEFNSYIQPFLIFLSIPFALIGVFFGLLIVGGQLNFAAFLGLVSLTGIVVSNGIVLIDGMNQLRDQGVLPVEAVRQAGTTRLRPVILSTLTSVFGVVPLIFVDDVFIRDLSLTLIAGQLFSTMLTLIFIPILYLRVEQRKERRRARLADV